MNIAIRAAATIDTLIEHVGDIKIMYTVIPKGTFITKDSEYFDTYSRSHRAENIINAIGDVLGMSSDALIRAARIVLVWYERTNWEKCLTDELAVRVLHTMREQDN